MAGPSVNLLAHLRPQTVTIAFQGRIWALHASTAADWIGAVAYDFDHLGGVFPGLVSDEDLESMYELLTDPQACDGLEECAQKALGAGGGRDWWWVRNLTRRAVNGWTMVNGFLLRQNVNPALLSFPDWLDACYTLMWEGCQDENSRIALEVELGMPPRTGKVHQTKQQTQAMLQAFAAD